MGTTQGAKRIKRAEKEIKAMKKQFAKTEAAICETSNNS
jgi:hypothetical protein